MEADKKAFLKQVGETTNGEAARVAEYERVLDDLIAWSEAQGGLLTFCPKPQANAQAKVEYRFKGVLFWDAWPQKRELTKFTYEYDFERGYLLDEFAKLSVDGRPASPKLPTVAFRDLVSDANRTRLKQLLGEVLTRLASQPTSLCDRNGRNNTVTDREILRVWNTLANRTYTEARVFSCVVSAYEAGNGEIDTKRAGEVMQVVWPENPVLGGVPSEIRGATANQNNNKNRQADFDRLMQLIHREL